MITVYTAEQLQAMPIAEIKAIAAANDLKPAADQNKRYKATWVNLVLSSVTAGTVTPEEFATFQDATEAPEMMEAEDDRDIERILLDAINGAGDAEQAAILREDLEAAAEYGQQVDRLLEQYQQVLQHQIDRLAVHSIPIPEAVNILWASAFTGSVSVDYGETFRAFRIVDAATDQPIVKLQTTAGIELDSRWVTTSGNRYIKAVLAALPAQIKKITAAMFSGCDSIVESLHGSTRMEGNDGEGPRGGNGRGEGRQDRIIALTYDIIDGF